MEDVVATVPSTGTMRSWSPPLVYSYGRGGVEEPGAE
jgi:hypothetical protein